MDLQKTAELLDEQMDKRTTRRTIVKTGAKIAYTAPIVAATFSMTRNSASAQTCPGRTQPIPVPGTGETICCGCTPEDFLPLRGAGAPGDDVVACVEFLGGSVDPDTGVLTDNPCNPGNFPFAGPLLSPITGGGDDDDGDDDDS